MNGNSSTDSFGKYQMQSSSSESKSKIVIEKLNGIVEPNVSPGKKSSSPVNDKPSSGAAPAPKPNMIAVKHKPGPVANNTNSKQMNGSAEGQNSKPQPPVNMIQVKKAPGKAAPASEPVTKVDESNPTQNQVKKKVNRIESSSSDSDSSDSDSSSSSSDDETTSQT